MVIPSPYDGMFKVSITYKTLKKWLPDIAKRLEKDERQLDAIFKEKFKIHSAVTNTAKEVKVNKPSTKTTNPYIAFCKGYRLHNNHKKWTAKELGQVWRTISQSEKDYYTKGCEPKPKLVSARGLAIKNANKRDLHPSDVYKEDPEYYEREQEQSIVKVRDYYKQHPEELDIQKEFAKRNRAEYVYHYMTALSHRDTFTYQDINMIDGLVWIKHYTRYAEIQKELDEGSSLKDLKYTNKDVINYNKIHKVVGPIAKLCKKLTLDYAHFMQNPSERLQIIATDIIRFGSSSIDQMRILDHVFSTEGPLW
jgi:hypothetical protein